MEHCEYRALSNEMIRDRILVGILNLNLSEQLQIDADLTLEKAITKLDRVRQSSLSSQ